MFVRMGQSNMFASEVFCNENTEFLLRKLYDDEDEMGELLGVLCTSGIVTGTEASMDRDEKGPLPDIQSFRVTLSDIMKTERPMAIEMEYLAMRVELVQPIQE